MGSVGANSARAFITEPMPSHGWATSMVVHAGKPSPSDPTPTNRLFISDVNSSNVPTSKRAETGAFNASAIMSYGCDGSQYTANITWVDSGAGYVQSAAMLWKDTRYAFGLTSAYGITNHGMLAQHQSGFDSDWIPTWYNRGGLPNSYAPDPFAHTSNSNEGWMTVGVNYTANRAPDRPINRTTLNVASGVPTYEGDFRDDDRTAGYGDRLNDIWIQVRRVGTSTLLMNLSGSQATSTEINNNRFSRQHAGTALTQGFTYEWRVMVSDAFGARSDWESSGSWVQFTYSSAGVVETRVTDGPRGKVNSTTPGPFTAKWTHPTLSANAVRVYMLRDGAFWRESGIITESPTIAPNGTLSVTYAETGFPAMEWGRDYNWRMQARDTNGNWSEYSADYDGSDFVDISTNKRPLAPSNLSPFGNQTALPLIQFDGTDPDDPLPPSGGYPVARVRLKSSTGTVLQTRAATWNAAAAPGRWSYQVTGADGLVLGTSYKYDAAIGDAVGYGPDSAEQTFNYVTGPSLTITSPTANQTITNHTPLVTFTTSGHTQWDYALYIVSTPDGADYSAAAAIRTYQDTSGATSFTIPEPYLHDGVTYRLDLSVTNLGITTTKSVQFTLDMPAIVAPLGLTIGDAYGKYDLDPTGIRISWNMTTYAPDEWRGMLIESSEDGIAWNDMFRVESPAIRDFTDWTVRSGTTRFYRVTQWVQQGNDVSASPPVILQHAVVFRGVVIHDVHDPNYRIVARYTPELSEDIIGQHDVQTVWGQRAPNIPEDETDYDVYSGTFQFTDELGWTAYDYYTDCTQLRRRKGRVLLWRDGRRINKFGKFTAMTPNRVPPHDWDIDYEFTEVDFALGVPS
jgi:hypothetical protein